MPRCGTRISTLRSALVRQRLGEQLAVRHVVRQQDQPRHRLVVVELRDEAIEHLLDGQRAVGLGKVGAVAPVLAGAEEEHLDARLPAVLRGGEDVGLLDALGVDRLIGGDVRQRARAGRGTSPRARTRAASAASSISC